MIFRPITYFKYIYPKLSNKCSICLDSINSKSIFIYCKDCFVVHHASCMKDRYKKNSEMDKQSCPLCRSDRLSIFYDYYSLYLRERN